MLKSVLIISAGVVGGCALLLAGAAVMADGESKGNNTDPAVDFSNVDSVVSSIDLKVREDAKDHKDQIRRVVRRFAETCPALFNRYAGDVVNATAYDKWVESYREERYGWNQEIALEVRMDEHASVAAGHLLTYYLGDGERPGWITQKAQGLEPCRRDGNSSGDTFVPVHDLYKS